MPSELVTTLHASPWASLPKRAKLLYVTTPARPGAWLAEALAADSAAAIELREAHGVAAAMTIVREEAYDAILIGHEPFVVDALEFVEALRAGGGDEPAIVLGADEEGAMTALALEAGADGYVRTGGATVRTLLWLVARAVERRQLVREHRRLASAERQRLERDRRDADRLLQSQRTLVAGLASLEAGPQVVVDESGPARRIAATWSTELFHRYGELLRAYVIMGAGGMTREIAALAAALSAQSASAAQVLEVHLAALDDIMRGLGSRGPRHVVSRADLFVLDVIVHLCEEYRRSAPARGAA